MLRIGLTGGIASGKSSVAEMFAELGAVLVDTDQVAREVVARGQPGLAAVSAEFGADILTPEGSLDRGKLRSIIFANAASRRRLEAILHPLIRQRTLQLLETAQGPYAIAVVPLLVETDFGSLVDRVLVVDCRRETQLKRLMHRDGLSEAEALAAIDAQIDRDSRLEAADDVIDNDGPPDATRRQVGILHPRYLAIADDCRGRSGRAK